VKSDSHRGVSLSRYWAKSCETRAGDLNLHTASAVDAISAFITIAGSRAKALQGGVMALCDKGNLQAVNSW
jgi:hypothetical protein